MKLTIPLVLAFSVISAALADASTLEIQQKDGTVKYISKDGTVKDQYFTKEQNPEAYCLAQNIYFESRNDSLAGQAAVADVVLNRVHDRRYPGTICEVVYQGETHASGKMKRNRCQFSWYCDGKPETIANKKAWIKAQYIAYQMMYANRYRGITEGATHYHAHYVNPKWADEIQYVDTIGSHKFYRWP